VSELLGRFWDLLVSRKEVLKQNVILIAALALIVGVAVAGATSWLYEHQIALQNLSINYETKKADDAAKRTESAESRLQLALDRLATAEAGLAALKSQRTPANVDDAVPVTFYAYSRNSSDEDIEMETFALKIDNKSQRVDGIFSGEVSLSGKVIPRTWTVRGFRSGDNLSLAYVTNPDKDTPIPVGIGTYQLRMINNTEYSGFSFGISCSLNSFIECPYVLSMQRVSTTEARVRWSRILNDKCVKRDLTPDSAVGFSCGNTVAK